MIIESKRRGLQIGQIVNVFAQESTSSAGSAMARVKREATWDEYKAEQLAAGHDASLYVTPGIGRSWWEVDID